MNVIPRKKIRSSVTWWEVLLLFPTVLFALHPAHSQTTRSSMPTSTKPELPEGTGKQIVQKVCTPCHDVSEFPLLNFDRADWELTVNCMVSAGAFVKKDEIALIIDYLSKNFKGKSTPGVTVPGNVQASIAEWNLPTPNSLPVGLFHENRGNVTWYAGVFGNVLGHFDLNTQKFEEIHLRPGSSPSGLAAKTGGGVQGTMFFTSRTGGFLGEFDPETADVREYRIDGPKLLLHDVAFDRNGMAWFTVMQARGPQYREGSKIGMLSQFTGEIKFADTPTRAADPHAIVINSKGIPFFTEQNSPRLGSIHPATMKITEYLLPNPAIGVKNLSVTPDDVVWYTDTIRGYLGKFDPKTGESREWPSPSGPSSRPDAITNADDIIWYSESGSTPNMLVRFDPKTEKFQSWPVKTSVGIDHLYAESNGSLWFTCPLANTIGHVTTHTE